MTSNNQKTPLGKVDKIGQEAFLESPFSVVRVALQDGRKSTVRISSISDLWGEIM